MFAFFDSIVDFLSNLVDFIVSMFESLLNIINLISHGVIVIGLAAAYLPDFLKLVALAFIGYCVAINILNKGG